MNDKTRGLYDKFRVERVDGSSEAGNKHFGCDYFVLDLTHDPHALPALAAYSVSCADEYPQLSADLKLKCGHVLAAWEVRDIEREALVQAQADRIAELEGICQSVPEGCTPADAAVLREANHTLAGANHAWVEANRSLSIELDRVRREWVPLYAGNKGNP
jgi:hypothetical protein